MQLVEAGTMLEIAEAGFYLAGGRVRLPVRGAQYQSIAASGRDAEGVRTRLAMEAAERYSVTYRAGDTGGVGTWAERGMWPFDELFPYLPEYRARAGMCRLQEERIGWTAATSLMSGRRVELPTASLFLEYEAGEPLFCETDTNGCAAGADMGGALSQALLELIERDALAIWWYGQIPRPELDARQMDGGGLIPLVEALAAGSQTVSLFLITADIAVPVVAAVIADGEGRHIYLGASARQCPHDAARKALEEAARHYFWEQVHGRSPSREIWFREGSLDRFPFLRGSGTHQIPPPPEPGVSAAESIERARDQLAKAGIDAYVVMMSRPEIGVPVVRVVAPGLRGPGFQWGPGRLFDVPVKLKWLQQARLANELTPYRCPI